MEKEERINQGIQFLKSMQGKNIPLSEQKKFLEGKMNEEEIYEVLKRVNSGETTALTRL